MFDVGFSEVVIIAIIALVILGPERLPKVARTLGFWVGKARRMVADVKMKAVQPWPDASSRGDTVWLGAVDSQGRAVSFIQSIYWEFGSATVLEETGITWQNRGTGFSLDPNHPNCLKPYRRPFHTIQPALAHLVDGSVMPYGSMGGEGQPQTQGMIFSLINHWGH